MKENLIENIEVKLATKCIESAQKSAWLWVLRVAARLEQRPECITVEIERVLK